MMKEKYPYLYVLVEHLRRRRSDRGRLPPGLVISKTNWDVAYKEMRDWCAENDWGLPLVNKEVEDEHFLLKGVPVVRSKE